MSAPVRLAVQSPVRFHLCEAVSLCPLSRIYYFGVLVAGCSTIRNSPLLFPGTLASYHRLRITPFVRLSFLIESLYRYGCGILYRLSSLSVCNTQG